MAEIDLRDQNNVRDMLPHKPMRLSMENKNLLSEKGDIYVGTGGTQTVTIEDDTYTIAETAKVSVPSGLSLNESAILIYDTANNLQYKKSSESGFVTYTVDQTGTIKDPSGQRTGPKTTLLTNIFNGLTGSQKNYVRSQIDAAAVSDLTFVSYTVDQTKIFEDSSEQGSSLKTTLLNNIFYGLTEDQKSSVRLNIGAGSAQGIAGITAGNGIKVDSSTPSSPKVSLDVNSISQSGNKYWVQIDNKNHPYVDVSVPSSDNQTIAYAPTTTSSVSDWIVFGNNATVKLVPGNNIDMTVNTNNNYIKIDAKTYTGGKGISVADGAISVNLATNSGLEVSSNQLKLKIGTVAGEKKYAVQLENGIPYVHVPWVNTTYTGSDGISVSNGAISVNLATNSGLEVSSNQLKLKIGTVAGEKKYAVQLENGIPYVNVPWVNTTYTGGNGISISGKTISLAEGYDVPIEYQSSASSTADFESGKLYLIGTWGGV